MREALSTLEYLYLLWLLEHWLVYVLWEHEGYNKASRRGLLSAENWRLRGDSPRP